MLKRIKKGYSPFPGGWNAWVILISQFKDYIVAGPYPTPTLRVVSWLVFSILEGESLPLSNDPHCDSRQQCVELGSEILSFLHAKLAVFLIKQCLILLSSSALRYPFPGLFLRLQNPDPATMKDFRGTLSKESAAKLQEKIKKEREGWR
ncbi:hypothetical protein LSS_01219 [Leptospira santarosai serovar Shermani str. LT 821]|uniref:Uncharacterized protein n=1 Tax=Leptospira santarosai serovar Shermani str. LT 821 TaxID=758847 RepID=K8Y4Z2_9LEPT|nr:hypothetical protein LSS_01219 [Leptospira santarosai serovar Shermani str. LT 821]